MTAVGYDDLLAAAGKMHFFDLQLLNPDIALTFHLFGSEKRIGLVRLACGEDNQGPVTQTARGNRLLTACFEHSVFILDRTPVLRHMLQIQELFLEPLREVARTLQSESE